MIICLLSHRGKTEFFLPSWELSIIILLDPNGCMKGDMWQDQRELFLWLGSKGILDHPFFLL